MDRARGIRPLLLLLLIAATSAAACSGPAGMDIAADADPNAEVDAGELDTGLSLRFRPSPGVQQPIDLNGASFSIREANINLSDLRLIGDAATGDDRTRIDLVRLQWNGSLGPLSSADFPEAPPGLYSLVRGAVTKFEIEVDVDQSVGDDFRIEIEYQDSPIAIDFALDYTLEAGAPLELEVVVDLGNVFSVIDLDQLEVEEGKVEIHEDDDAALLQALGEALSQSFAVQQIL